MRAMIKVSEEFHCDEIVLLNDRFGQKETLRWRNAECLIRRIPLLQWLKK
jgi:hypothetical protein